MASRGFEFAYMLDGSNKTPVIRDFILGVAADHLVGDAMIIQSDGFIDEAIAGTTVEPACIIMEQALTADVTAETTTAKCAILQREQVWRCSMDATSTTALVGFTKVLNMVDKNTIDATPITGGNMILVDKSESDDEGNVLAYVVFSDTAFGNT